MVRSLGETSGSGIAVKMTIEQHIAVDVVGQRLVGEHQAVADHVQREVADVLGQDIGAVTDEGQSARAARIRLMDARGLAPKRM